MSTFSIATLGCKTNQFESNTIEQQLLTVGFSKISFEDGADLVVINTCTVTSKTDAQSRNLIRRARRYNKESRIVVTGCYAQIDPTTLSSIEGVALVIGNDQKQSFISTLIEAKLASSGNNPQSKPLTRSISGRSRAFLQIQNGCNAFCSYCIIPYARGRSLSFPEDEIIQQLRQLETDGYSEVVLTGIHIGGYGKDLTPCTSLFVLVTKILSATDTIHIRLGSIEPNEIPAELIDLIAREPRICSHLHIPLQSGNNKILKEMNRHYLTADFATLIELIDSKIASVGIGLDIIVGFPGETEDEFESTYDFIDSLPISNLHVFPYSVRPGTPAALMGGQLPGNIIKDRAERLRRLSEKKQRKLIQSMIDCKTTCIIEDVCIDSESGVIEEVGGKPSFHKGTCDNYQTVWIQKEKKQDNREIKSGRRVEILITDRLYDNLPIATLA